MNLFEQVRAFDMAAFRKQRAAEWADDLAQESAEESESEENVDQILAEVRLHGLKKPTEIDSDLVAAPSPLNCSL
jgi:hypothetical protein